MNISDLELFLTAVEEGSFAKAARRSFIAQQAFSMCIKRLERTIGTTLFDRTPFGVTLTKAGVLFLPTAHQIVQLAEESKTVLQGRAGAVADNHLTIGVVSPAAYGLITAILRGFHAAFPHTTVAIRSLQFSDIALALTLSRIDVLLSLGPFSFPGWKAHTLYSEPLTVAVTKLHPFAQAGHVLVHDVVDETFVHGKSLPPGWVNVGHLSIFRQGSSPRLGDPLLTDARTPMEVNEVVAAGLAVVPVPFSHRIAFPHPMVQCVPLMDSPEVNVIAAIPDDASSLKRTFVSLAVQTSGHGKHVLLTKRPRN